MNGRSCTYNAGTERRLKSILSHIHGPCFSENLRTVNNNHLFIKCFSISWPLLYYAESIGDLIFTMEVQNFASSLFFLSFTAFAFVRIYVQSTAITFFIKFLNLMASTLLNELTYNEGTELLKSFFFF